MVLRCFERNQAKLEEADKTKEKLDKANTENPDNMKKLYEAILSHVDKIPFKSGSFNACNDRGCFYELIKDVQAKPAATTPGTASHPGASLKRPRDTLEPSFYF